MWVFAEQILLEPNTKVDNHVRRALQNQTRFLSIYTESSPHGHVPVLFSLEFNKKAREREREKENQAVKLKENKMLVYYNVTPSLTGPAMCDL